MLVKVTLELPNQVLAPAAPRDDDAEMEQLRSTVEASEVTIRHLRDHLAERARNGEAMAARINELEARLHQQTSYADSSVDVDDQRRQEIQVLEEMNAQQARTIEALQVELAALKSHTLPNLGDRVMQLQQVNSDRYSYITQLRSLVERLRDACESGDPLPKAFPLMALADQLLARKWS